MNGADRFAISGWPRRRNEKNETANVQNAQRTIWGNVTSALKSTVHSASHEFDRIFDSMGFKTKSIVQFSDQDNLKASSPTKHNDYANDTHSTSDVESQDTKTTCFKENEDITGSSDHMKPTPRESPNKSILSSRLNTDDRSFKEEQAKLQALNSEHCPLLNTSQSVARADQVPSATPRVRLVEPPKEAETQKELIPQDTERRIEGGMRIGSRLAELHGIEPHQDKEDMRIERLEKCIRLIRSEMKELRTLHDFLATRENRKPVTVSTQTSMLSSLAQSPIGIRSPSKIVKKRASPIKRHKSSAAPEVHPHSTLISSAYRNQINAPDDSHLSSMQRIIEEIREPQLRRTDMIVGADGSMQPNPFWAEIYGPKQRPRSKRPLEEDVVSSSKRRQIDHGPI